MEYCTKHTAYIENPRANYCGSCGIKIERNEQSQLEKKTNDIKFSDKLLIGMAGAFTFFGIWGRLIHDAYNK